MTERSFPMQRGPAIPWCTAEIIYEAYAALFGNRQSLERLGERGGFGWGEVAVIFAELAKRNPAKHRQLLALAASVDTHPKDGDVEQAPLVSGAVGEAETPDLSRASITIARRGK